MLTKPRPLIAVPFILLIRSKDHLAPPRLELGLLPRAKKEQNQARGLNSANVETRSPPVILLVFDSFFSFLHVSVMRIYGMGVLWTEP